MRLLFVYVPLAVLAGRTATAQELLWQRTGGSMSQHIGWGSDSIADLNGDGCADLAQITLACNAAGLMETHLEFVSGRDGTVLRRRRGGEQWVRPFTKIAGAGDMDGDGVSDYVVSIHDRNAALAIIEVRSAIDDRLIWSVSDSAPIGVPAYLPGTLLGDLDLDGDGRPDLLVGLPYAPVSTPGLRGSYRAYSSSGGLLYELMSNQTIAWSLCCWRLADRMGDVDGNGCDDALVAIVIPSIETGGGAVISGRTGAVLCMGIGDPLEGLGFTVATIGDIDSDGVPDFASSNGGDRFVPNGVVRAFSGRTGARIHFWIEPRRGQNFGASLLGGLDVDQDGCFDLMIGSSGEGSPGGDGVIRCFSGCDASLLLVMEGMGVTTLYDLVRLGTQPGHPYPLFAVTFWHFPGNIGCFYPYQGKLQVYRMNPAGVVPLGPGCTGTLGEAPRMGVRDRGNAGLRISLSSAPPASYAGLFLGLSSTSIGTIALPYALDPHGFPGCSLFTSSDFIFTSLTGTSGSQQGQALLDLPEPYLASAVPGLTIHGQWIALDPSAGPGAVSNALSWTYR